VLGREKIEFLPSGTHSFLVKADNKELWSNVARVMAKKFLIGGADKFEWPALSWYVTIGHLSGLSSNPEIMVGIE
jgi:hypothetical protein